MSHTVIRNGILWLVLCGVALPAVADSVKAPASSARRLKLIEIVREDCGSCHGSRLTGSLGPALTPQALQGKPSQMLIHVILDGRPGTPMPPWKPFISKDEAAWIVDQLKRGFPDAP
jgi:cytochrome c55X